MTKPVITTRAGKGSALTWTEGDTNLENLRDATITVKADTGGTDVVSDLNGTVTIVAGTNVTITGDNTAKTVTINSTAGGATTLDGLSDVNTSGAMNNHVLKYNSTATEWQSSLLDVPTNLDSLTDVTVSGPSDGQVLKYNNSMSRWENGTVSGGIASVSADTSPSLGGNLNVNGNSIVSSSNGDINLTPNGTGKVVTTKTLNANILASTQSAGDEGGQIELALASTNNLLTGSVAIDINQSQLRIFETGGSNRGVYLNLADAGTSVGTNLLSGGGATTLDGLSDVIVTSPSNGQVLKYNNISSSWENSVITTGITTLQEDGAPQLGGNLDVNGNNIVSTTNQNIVIAPNGTGRVSLDGVLWPAADGTNGQVLTTNGAGSASWATASSGGIANVVEDTTPQLGGDLDIQDYKITSSGSSGTMVFQPSSTFDEIRMYGQYLYIGNTAGSSGEATIGTVAAQSLILGPNQGGYSRIRILRNANGNIEITPDGTGITKIQTTAGGATALQLSASGEVRFADSDSSNYVGFKAPATVSTNKVWTLPAADGTANQVLKTDGSGTLGWASAGSSASFALATAQSSLYSSAGGKNITWSENYDSASCLSINGTTGEFTLTSGSYIVSLQGMGRIGSQGNGLEFYNVTGASQIKDMGYSFAWDGGTTFMIPVGSFYLTPGSSTTYVFRFTGSVSSTSITSTVLNLVITKLA